MKSRASYRGGRLSAKPIEKTSISPIQRGIHSLKLDDKKDGLIYVPKNYEDNKPAALVVLFHGAGGNAQSSLSILNQFADERNIILIAPSSQSRTWDLIVNNAFDADVIYLDQALQLVFDRYVINPKQIAIGGFSDGASYALCLGLSNGHLFTHILAFSPGFAYAIEKEGKPKVFISHGIDDIVLPIHPCSRRIVRQLQTESYHITYKEFLGAHTIPSTIANEAIDWFFGK
jgi:phospholipase/carboxylesterase